MQGKLHHVFTHRRVAAILAAFVVVLAWPALSGAAAVDDITAIIVALSGDASPAPGNPTFSSFDEPMADSVGDVVFQAFLSDERDGIFFKRNKKGSTVELISATDVAIPGFGTPTFYDGPAISPNGIIAFVAGSFTIVPVAPAGTPSISEPVFTYAVLRQRPKKPLEIIAKTGDVAPGTGGAVFTSFDDLAVNRKGDVAFIASYTGNKTGIFLSTKKALMPVVLSGDSLPGTGGTTDGFLDGPWLNEKDDVAFAPDSVSGAQQFEGSIFLKKFKKPIESLLLMGATAPSSVGGVIVGINVGRPALNNQDVLAFKADTDVSLLVATATVSSPESFVGAVRPEKGITVCAIQGQGAPDTAGTFDGFGSPALAGNTLEFRSDLIGDGSNPDGIFTCADPTSKKPLVREAVLPSDPKPTGSWGTLEEDSVSQRWVVFDDEDGSPVGIFITKKPGSAPDNPKS